eukprot:CAMPEP_0185782096 /NCGR_PEP_ID=MMETSP1174-20130828/106505_1 /TAXON_ID=35687 /ORGANISM="Dictyocha speculum, Strain CCMP1381" /LENGTH=75 /DNA_ID=CAMNT_0028472397 /DNA_START=32 /DNA_END=255 /DNA_ORIENTATION=-
MVRPISARHEELKRAFEVQRVVEPLVQHVQIHFTTHGLDTKQALCCDDVPGQHQMRHALPAENSHQLATNFSCRA